MKKFILFFASLIILLALASPVVRNPQDFSRQSLLLSCIGLAVFPLIFYFRRFESRATSNRMIAVIAVLVAANVGLRQAVHGVGPSPIFFLVILAGYLLGPFAGFMLGSCTILVSNFFVGGHGPWTLFQMTALGLVGFFAAFIPKSGFWREKIMLTVFGFLSGLGYGLATDFFSWLFFMSQQNLQTFIAVSLRGLGFSASYGFGNAFFIFFFSTPIIKVLRRFRLRFETVYLD